MPLQLVLDRQMPACEGVFGRRAAAAAAVTGSGPGLHLGEIMPMRVSHVRVGLPIALRGPLTSALVALRANQAAAACILAGGHAFPRKH